MWEIGDKIKYLSFNGEREGEIVKEIDDDHFLCRLENGKCVVVHYMSII